jgi:hypothetical protein
MRELVTGGCPKHVFVVYGRSITLHAVSNREVFDI